MSKIMYLKKKRKRVHKKYTKAKALEKRYTNGTQTVHK